jgi:hypothetical protein
MSNPQSVFEIAFPTSRRLWHPFQPAQNRLIKDQLKATGGIVMANFYTDDFLRMLRNKVKIDRVIDLLMLDTRQGKDLLRFRCPLCHGFHTATNPQTNLARCFDCSRNFNPIDLVMAVTACSFVETVEFLKNHLTDTQTS